MKQNATPWYVTCTLIVNIVNWNVIENDGAEVDHIGKPGTVVITAFMYLSTSWMTKVALLQTWNILFAFDADISRATSFGLLNDDHF